MNSRGLLCLLTQKDTWAYAEFPLVNHTAALIGVFERGIR